MFLKRLLLRNFRNYSQAEVLFSEGVNLILGENGQGKTNLLEAIHFVSTGRSFRASSLSDLIAFGESFFYLEAEFYKDGVGQLIKIYYDENTRKIQYNEKIYPTLTSLLGILPSILLSPDDLSLVSGGPTQRRRFLDIHIAQSDPMYVHHLGRYFKAMKQRNHLLRSKSTSSIESWEAIMALSASYLILKRDQAVKALKPISTKWMEILSRDQDSIDVQYQCSFSMPQDETAISSHLQKIWQKNRPREILLNSTQIGPHRDDLLIQLAGKAAKLFSSEGQKRSCISSLRFAQWEQMAEILGVCPMLGIDDFGIQLDKERQGQLKTHLSKFNQVFLTSPNMSQSDILEGTSLRSFLISKGTVTECAL